MSKVFWNDHECFKHSHCHSGFCLAGKCATPSRTHDHCNVEYGLCPVGHHCSPFSHTCIPYGYQRRVYGCVYESDCSHSERCILGTCRTQKKVGSLCATDSPDYCETGSKCTSANLRDTTTRCYELCNSAVPCPSGFTCSKTNGVCLPDKGFFNDIDTWQALQTIALIIGSVIILFGLIYMWIKATTHTHGRDPRLRKKRVRLQYEGNGLATITVVPSPDQSPAPVPASHLFNDNSDINYPPPPYSEVVTINPR